MKFKDNKKQTIIRYILEKIDNNQTGLSNHVSEAFNINQNTVHRYINELVEDNIIKRVKRGEYELISKEYNFRITKNDNIFNSDFQIYISCLKPYTGNMPNNIISIWEYAFSEMVNNVIDHSSANNLCITIKQNFLNTEVFISDDGVGIFEKLKKYFDFPTLDDAICELFKGKLTTDSTRHSGEGIFFTSKIMDTFFIASSKKIFAINKFEESAVADLISDSDRGTTVYMTLSNFSQKSIKEVFDLYSNIDGGFAKTTIPLKNIFDSAPVSRSQAKRICNGLEKFKEVELDFKDLDWMGQGFAHQIFVVFANANPQIKLTPINMDEDVKKMYNHVTYIN